MIDTRFAKFVLLVNALVPGSLLAWDAAHHQLGANPVNFAILTTGMLTLVFIGLTLLVTPLRQITGFHWLFPFRKTLGLFAFFYGMTHFAIFFVLDRALSISSTLSEMVKRPYLVIGSIALFLMIPLALTSFDVAIKKMGARRWKWLHRLVYITAILAVIHYYMQVKADIRKPLIFAGVFALLLGYRIVAWFLPRKAAGIMGKWSGQLRVEKITQETPNVRTFRLVSLNGRALPFTYQPGQYLTLSLPIGERTIKRSYTIASTPTRPEACELTIKREQPGTSSRHMHEAIHVGDLIQLTAPSGRFTFTGKGEQGVVLIAGGVGITPLISILRSLTDRRWPGVIHLIYSNKSQEDIIFREEIERLEKQHDNLHVTFTLTRGGPNWSGRAGRIDATLLRERVPYLASLPVFICGPEPMLTTMRELLPAIGVPDAQIHFESFGTARAPDGAVLAEVKTFEVKFSTSRKVAPAPSDVPLLDIAENVGIDLDYECRAGVCGRCKCKLLSGSVIMPTQDALEPEEKARGLILMCQARATEDLTVEA